MKSKTKYRTSKRELILFLLVLFFTFNLKSQSSKYDINDPRNPQCPCHKYQKLAEEEYKKMLRAGNKGVGEFAGKTNLREDKIHKTRIEKYRKQKRRIKDKPRRRSRWIYEFKNWDIWKRATNPSKCPIWNG